MSEAIDDIEHAIERASDVLHDSRYWKDDGVYAAYITPALERLSAALTLATQRAEAAEAERDKWYDNAVKERVRRVSAEAASASADAEADTLRAERDAPRVECEALRKDVARLDWLDSQKVLRASFYPLCFPPCWVVEASEVTSGETLRVAIDAAMAVQPTTSTGDPK